MSQTVNTSSQNGVSLFSNGRSTISGTVVSDFTNIIADGNNFASITVVITYTNNENVNITGVLNLQGDNGDLQSKNIDLSIGGYKVTDYHRFRVTNTSPSEVTYRIMLNTSIGNLTLNPLVINYVSDTPQNRKLAVTSGASRNVLLDTAFGVISASPSGPPSAYSDSVTSNFNTECPPRCPACPSPICPTPSCPTPSCPACPACPTANCPTNTKSSVTGSEKDGTCVIDYTPIIIIGVLIIVLLIILLYLQLTNSK